MAGCRQVVSVRSTNLGSWLWFEALTCRGDQCCEVFVNSVVVELVAIATEELSEFLDGLFSVGEFGETVGEISPLPLISTREESESASTINCD